MGERKLSTESLPFTRESTELWQAAEWLVAADPVTREQGFTYLTQHDAARFSPLVCYLLLSMIDDADARMRAASIHVLAGVFARNHDQYIAPDATRQYVSGALRNFRSEQTRHMLEVMGRGGFSDSRAHPEALARLLDRVPAASEQLMHIASNRRIEPPVRIAALQMIGELGLLDALPALKSLQERIAGRRASKLSRGLAARADPTAAALLDMLHETIQLLEDEGAELMRDA